MSVRSANWAPRISLALSFTVALYSAEIPVKQVTLYKHGIGYFERSGSIAAGDEARLDFKNSDMNDVLKSLTVTESGGGRVTGIRYDSNESLQQQLAKYPFTIGTGEFLSAFLDSIKGERIELKSGDRPVTGTIIGARAIESGPDANKTVLREQITLLLDSGDVANFDLTASTSLHLLDPQLQNQLKQYLQALAKSKSVDKRSVYIDSASAGGRNLQVSYITPTAIWKSSYRLTMGDSASTLEGWAVVDNTSDDDWDNVRLSVVSGRPISFISLLDTPRYGQRQVAELPEDRAAGPVVYGGSVDSLPSNGRGFGAGSGGYVSGSLNGAVGSRFAPKAKMQQVEVQSQAQLLATPPPPQSAPIQYGASAGLSVSEQMASTSSSIEGATGATLGELFEYNFAGPVTIKKNQSAMLPFLQDKVNARKLLIYSDANSEHPVNAAEVTNGTNKTLDGGPITVYDGGAYAGEALFETVKAGDKRLIGYAVDYGTRVTTAYGSGGRLIREIHANNGNLNVRLADRQTRTYTIKNIDAKAKTLIVEQASAPDFTNLSPKPIERTAKAFRFEVRLPANGSEELKVEQEHVTLESYSVGTSNPASLVTYISNKQLSEQGRKQLQGIVDLKKRIADTDAQLSAAKEQANEIGNDQNRLRQNIDSLNRVKGQEDQVSKYSTQLSANEVQLSKLRDQTREFNQTKASLEAELRTQIENLDF